MPVSTHVLAKGSVDRYLAPTSSASVGEESQPWITWLPGEWPFSRQRHNGHVRRKYVKAEPFAPTCTEAIDLIAKLYEIERGLPNPYTLTGAEQEAALAHILAVRRERSAPVVEAIKAWAGRQQGLPESTFRKAIKYMLDLWHGLTVFLENPWVPLDNNLVERQIRPLVVGRKNHYGSKSKRGTEVAALFYSLIETAQLRGEDPAAYLQRAALAAIADPGTVTLPTPAE